MERSSTCRLAVLALCSAWMIGATAQDVPIDPLDDDDICSDDDLDDIDDDDQRVVARLHGFCQVPSISTSAEGAFQADIDDTARMITWTMTYQNFETPVEQAHIHLGERHTNGGISAFLCTNLDNAPADIQTCPETTATISGTITPEQVVGPEDQGITTAEFEELVQAIRAGATYVNVHTTAYPAGEIRGQIVDDDD